MKFTRVNLIEAILYILECFPNESFEIRKLYNKVKKIITYIPEEEVFKFQFIISIDFLSKIENLNYAFMRHDYIIKKNPYFTDINVNYNNTIDPYLRLNFDYKNIKKIFIDIKNNSEIYDKIGKEIIFDTIVKNL